MALKEILDEAVARINVPDFIPADPVQFPHRFTDKRDIEIVSFLIATISWGKRQMILRNADKILGILENAPYHFVLSGNIDNINEDHTSHILWT